MTKEDPESNLKEETVKLLNENRLLEEMNKLRTDDGYFRIQLISLLEALVENTRKNE